MARDTLMYKIACCSYNHSIKVAVLHVIHKQVSKPSPITSRRVYAQSSNRPAKRHTSRQLGQDSPLLLAIMRHRLVLVCIVMVIRVVAERKRHTRVQQVPMSKRFRYTMGPSVKGVCPEKKRNPSRVRNEGKHPGENGRR